MRNSGLWHQCSLKIEDNKHKVKTEFQKDEKEQMTGQKTDYRIKKKFQEKRQKLKNYWINIRGLGKREKTEVKKSEQNLRREEGTERELLLWTET